VTFVQVGIPTLDLKLVIAYAALQIMVEVHGAVKVRQCHGGLASGCGHAVAWPDRGCGACGSCCPGPYKSLVLSPRFDREYM